MQLTKYIQDNKRKTYLTCDMRIDGETKIYGVFGYPIEHTLSPVLHNAVFEKRGVNAVYLPFKIKSDDLPMAMEGVKAMGYGGINITLPHKEQAIHYVDATLHPMDKAIGAINTLVMMDGRLLGSNTDGPGFMENLREKFNTEPKGKRVLVLGAGGAARAVTFALLEAEVGELYIHNRTTERAKGLAGYLKKYFPKANVDVIDTVMDIGKKKIDLLVNCTSCGMHDKDPFPVNPDILSQTKRVYDLVYTANETKLVHEARDRGLEACDGLGMLLHQAVVAHRLWFPEVSKTEIYDIMKEAFAAWKA